MSTYAGSDDCTDIILDFIAGGVPDNPSGESRGNYNCYFGHINATDDLGKLTLDEVYDFQSQMLKRDRRSTAIGRYQFLKRTLKGLQDANDLGDDTPFTPVLQDFLAVKLLVGRGYQEWWNGGISDEEFAHRLSLEWASLPDPGKGGRSHYDGDSAGNHASTTLDAVYNMLERARAAKSRIPNKTEPCPTARELKLARAIATLNAIIAQAQACLKEIEGV